MCMEAYQQVFTPSDTINMTNQMTSQNYQDSESVQTYLQAPFYEGTSNTSV